LGPHLGSATFVPRHWIRKLLNAHKLTRVLILHESRICGNFGETVVAFTHWGRVASCEKQLSAWRLRPPSAGVGQRRGESIVQRSLSKTLLRNRDATPIGSAFDPWLRIRHAYLLLMPPSASSSSPL